MRLLHCLCLGAVLSTIGGPPARAGMDVAFEDVGAQPQPTHALAGLSALLEVETGQSLRATTGILFTVELHNGSKRPIRLTNPLDTLDYSLTDEDGQTLQLPSRGFLKLRVNTRRPIDTQAFRIVSLEIDGQRVTERDELS